MNTYDAGNVVTVAAVFTDKDTGDSVDPTAVTAKVKDPLGVVTNYVVTSGQIVRDSLGDYHLDLQPDIQGVWVYEWKGTGTNKSAKQNSFQIRESAFD
jgi:uncharacterized protein YfaS (alpha-2-macroglobulin family)